MKALLLISCIIMFVGCGSHESKNEGFTQTGDVNDGLKDGSVQGKLKTAMDTGDISVFLAMIAEGAPVDTRLPNTKNATLLIYTATKNLPKFTHFLVLNGADPTLTDDDGNTAFQIAESIGNRTRILMLLDPERQKQAQADLLDAIKKKKVPTIEELLKSGANPNFIDEATGETPLNKTTLLKKGTHVAKFIAEWKDPEIGITGTDINFPNAAGLTPLAFAITQNNQDVINLLKSLNAKETL